jgi:Flp pilus assembly CpaE family ATPase
MIAFLMGLDPQYSIVDAIQNVDRLDRACWSAIVAHGDGLEVVASPGRLGKDELPAEDLRRVFNLVRSFYQWIVIDFGRLNGVWRSFADVVDELFVVTTTALPALYETKRTIGALVGGGTDRERLRLIVNRTEAGQSLSGSELKQVFGIPVYATLPNDSQELRQACLQRRLPTETSDVGRQMANLARQLAGLKDNSPKNHLAGLRSFVGRFRKTVEDAPVTRSC